MRTLLVVALLVGVVAVPLLHKVDRDRNYRNFRVVADGELYRSGQMTLDGFRRVVREHGIRTVISLRDSDFVGEVPPDQAEADFCATAGVAFHRLSPASWIPRGGEVPAAKNVADIRRVFDDPATERPILMHCFAGIHRTGAYTAVYRMTRHGWSADDAIAEMRSMGTPRTTFEDDVIDFLTAYPANRRR